MSELRFPLIESLQLVTPDRQFPPRTPHSYAHVGDAALLDTVEFILPDYPDLPETRRMHEA